jgi:hypothetical protein
MSYSFQFIWKGANASECVFCACFQTLCCCKLLVVHVSKLFKSNAQGVWLCKCKFLVSASGDCENVRTSI